jgi:hypothetical protein
LIRLRKINVLQRFGSSRWRQVGVIIGVLGGKPENIETVWLGELDSEDLPRVLGGLGRFARDVPRGLGVLWAGKVRHHGRAAVLASVLGWLGGRVGGN